MADRPQARVLIVDDDPIVGRQWKAILKREGYQVEAPHGSGATLARLAEESAWRFRPHVAVVDLCLEDGTQDDSGLRLLEQLRHARCILYSSYLRPEIARLAALKYGAASWVSKSEPPQHLLDEIAEQAQRCCAARLKLNLAGAAGMLDQAGRALLDAGAPPGLVEDVLAQLFPPNSTITLEPLEGGIAIPDMPSSVGRGRAAVLKVWQSGRFEPLVVKLAPAAKIRAEAEHYQEFIHGNLGGQFHAILEKGPAIFWDVGGVLYSFLGISGKSPDLHSFANYYRNQPDVPALVRPLRHLFQDVWYNFYQDKAPLQKPLFAAYAEALHRFEERLQRFPDQEPLKRFPGVPAALPNPVAWVLRHAHRSAIPNTYTAVTHGDLHGDNLFVDGNHSWVIDFERSGRGPILRDFVELEVDIVTRLTEFSPHDLAMLYELARTLVEPTSPTEPLRLSTPVEQDPAARKSLGVIAKMRNIAGEVTGYTDFREYLWGLLLDAVFVATLLPAGHPQRERALLLGAVLCERLQQESPALRSD